MNRKVVFYTNHFVLVLKMVLFLFLFVSCAGRNASVESFLGFNCQSAIEGVCVCNSVLKRDLGLREVEKDEGGR